MRNIQTKRKEKERNLGFTKYRNTFKSGESCSNCGVKGEKLVFHHIIPSGTRIAHLTNKTSIKKEIGKTELLCAKCHAKVHK